MYTPFKIQIVRCILLHTSVQTPSLPALLLKLLSFIAKTMSKPFPLLITIFLLICLGVSCTGSPADTAPVEESVRGQVAPPAIQSLLGRPLLPWKESAAARARKDSLLAIARADWDEDPEDLDHIIWYGRRIAYLFHYQEAIEVFTAGMERYPDVPELFRHRGHRYISIRNFDAAIADFQKASDLMQGRPVEIEPDGIPNKLNKPLSSLQFNVWYHLGLAHYLKGEFVEAERAYLECMKVSTNPDLLVATADWLYMTFRRQGKEDEAAAMLHTIGPDLEIIENESYYKRLQMYQGKIAPEELLDLENTSSDVQLDIVTQGYGVGNWYYYNGDKAKALDVFRKVVAQQYWPAFGYIAAEAELARSVGTE